MCKHIHAVVQFIRDYEAQKGEGEQAEASKRVLHQVRIGFDKTVHSIDIEK